MEKKSCFFFNDTLVKDLVQIEVPLEERCLLFRIVLKWPSVHGCHAFLILMILYQTPYRACIK